MKKLFYILLFVPFALFGQDNYFLSFDEYSLNLNGYGNHVVVSPSHSLDTISSFSIGGWFNIRSIQSGAWNPSLLHKINTDGDLDSELNVHPEGFALQILTEPFEPQSHYSFFLMTNYGQDKYLRVNSESVFSENEWTHIMCTYSNRTAKIFINGVLDNESNWEYDLAIPVNQFFTICADIDDLSINGEMGVSYTDTPITLDGSVDDVCFFDLELSHAEIQSYMNCPPTGNEEGLVGYWNFNEGSGNTVYDLSGNGNHGTIYGATYSDEAPEQNCESSDEPSIIDQLNQSFDAWNISIDLSSGWNMFGYGCPSSINVADGLSNHTASIIITKDNNGNVYMPEFGFNGIGDFTPGFGYQIKLTEAIEGFSLCDWYVNDIPEDNIVSLQEENANLENEVANLESELDSIQNGCTDSTACNYSSYHLYDDGSCLYPELGFDCNNNIIPYVGMEAFGGIIFHIDSVQQKGLVVAHEDIQELYMWGCMGSWLDGADNHDIYSGYENTLDILLNCSERPIGASIVIDYESEGYSDWYLPSIGELELIYHSVGPGNETDYNLANLQLTQGPFYMTSTEVNNNSPYMVNMTTGSTSWVNKNSLHSIRPVRTFIYGTHNN